MSVPARRLTTPALPAPGQPERSVPPARERVARPARTPEARPTPSTPPQRRARRGAHPAFWVFTAVLMTSLILAVVALNALVVNATYRLRSTQEQQRVLSEDGAALRIEVARLSSPSRIARWAGDNDLRMPASDEVISLRVPGSGGGSG
jgi:cell division protein FtsL